MTQISSDPICTSIGCKKVSTPKTEKVSESAPPSQPRVYDEDIIATMKTIEDAEKGKYKITRNWYLRK